MSTRLVPNWFVSDTFLKSCTAAAITRDPAKMATSNSTRVNPRVFFRCMTLLNSLAESRNICDLGIRPDHPAQAVLHPDLHLAFIGIRTYPVLQEHSADYYLPLKI